MVYKSILYGNSCRRRIVQNREQPAFEARLGFVFEALLQPEMGSVESPFEIIVGIVMPGLGTHPVNLPMRFSRGGRRVQRVAEICKDGLNLRINDI